MMSKAECSLRDLHVGDKGRIERVSVSGELGRRIRDLGLIPGTSITVVGRAPLRDPVALRLEGVTIMLRPLADQDTVLPAQILVLSHMSQLHLAQDFLQALQDM